jgi:hypothetical protein
MKAKMLAATVMMSIILMVMTMGADAMMAGPPDDTHMGPGMNSNDPPGPRWQQQTGNKQVEKGLMFRWGKETPEASIESESTGDDIGIRMEGLRFRNNTLDLNVDIEEEEWEVIERIFPELAPDLISVNYRSNISWKNLNGSNEHTSETSIIYRYGDTMDRSIEYRFSISDPPVNGNISYSIAVENIEAMKGCCWKKETSNQHQNHNSFTLTSESGERLSQFNVHRGTVFIDEEYLDWDANVSEQLVNSTASIEVGMSLPVDAKYASFGGSLSILDGLVESFVEGAEEAAEFVIDHIYYFAGGAAVMIVIIIAGVALVSKKKVDTNGKELDLGSNKYYKGPQ